MLDIASINMVVIFATLGYEAKSAIPSIKIRDNVEKLVVYHSLHKKAEDAFEKLSDYCDKMNLKVEKNELKDPFNLIGIALTIRKKLKEYSKKDVVFNITGGTKVMSAAALLACILEGVPAVYCNENTGREDALPLIQMKYESFLTSQQKNILKIVKNTPDGRCTATDIIKKTKLTKPTVSHHIKELLKMGLIVTERADEDSRKRYIKIIDSVNLLDL